jgi:purine nucleosidase
VHGNASVDITTDNAHALLLAAGAGHVPVARGAARPMAQAPSYAPEVHGVDGLGGVRALLPPSDGRATGRAVDEILRQSERHAGQLDIVAVGPLTNLGLALVEDPTLPSRVHAVYVMGGAFDARGNITTTAEANIYHDPEAADLVFTAPWRVVVVGLDVTMKVTLEASDLSALAADKRPFVAALGRMSESYAGFYRHIYGRVACAQHDALAAAAAFAPDLMRYERRRVRVELRGEHTRGMTVSLRPAPGEPTVDVAVAVDAEAARADILRAIGRLS